MIDGAEEFVRQQHGLQGSVVWRLEVDRTKKLLWQPAFFVRFLQNLIVHLVPCLTCLWPEKKQPRLTKNSYTPLPPNSKNMKSTQGTCIDLWCQCSPKSLSQMAVQFAVLENLCKLWQNILEHLEATKIPKPISSGKNVQALMKYLFQTAPKVLLFPLLPAFV